MELEPHATIDAKIAALETSVGGIKSDIASLVVTVRDLANQIAQKGATNWGAIFSGAGVLVAVLGFIGNQALSPVRDAVLENKERVRTLETNIVPRREHDHVWSEQSDFLRRLESRIDRLEYGPKSSVIAGAK